MKSEADDSLTMSLYDDLDDPPAVKTRDSPWGSPYSSPYSPPAESSDRKRAKDEEADYEPTLVWNLRRADKEAMSTFIELEECTYQNKSLGSSRQLEESMMCECSWDPDNPEDACGKNCINRLTQVECLVGECRCRSRCRNQRFQRKQYAPLEIVQTEKKGYGVRASQDLEADAFIWEYIGEVIPHNTFVKRIKEYADTGIEHFYFMMLQKDEYIDATRKGGCGRFLNHSCRPNCYVAKWVVGKKMRMGIFAKRDILAGEELTFNYNVDRYGHDAQECFCGESNCVGFIGGKTQTDIGAMDDLYLDALGIADDVEAFGLKGSKKRKGKKLDEDYIPSLKPIRLDEAPKVASAIRQATSIKRILTKLLYRVQITTDTVVSRRMLQLHGISLMGGVLHEHEEDVEIVAPVIEILLGWPLMTRNKLVSSNVEPLIEKFTLSETEAVAARAQELVKFWATLELGYRIPKAVQEAVDSHDSGAIGNKRKNEELFESLAFKRARLDGAVPNNVEVVDVDDDGPRFQAAAATVVDESKRELPEGWRYARSDTGVPYYFNATTLQNSWVFPTAEVVAALAAEHKAKQQAKLDTVNIDDIIGRARLEAQQREALRLAEEAAQAAERAKRKQEAIDRQKRKEEARKKEKAAREQKKSKAGGSSSSKSKHRDPEKDKEKACLRAFGAVVVSSMSRYKSQIDHEQFKRRAKEITHLLVEKEHKSPSYAKESYSQLSKEKTAKIRKFVDDFMQKLLSRMKSSRPSTPAKAALATNEDSSTATPTSPSKVAAAEAADNEAMVRELAGGGSDDEDDHSSMEQSDGETPNGDHDTPGSTPSTGTRPIDKAAAALPPPSVSAPVDQQPTTLPEHGQLHDTFVVPPASS